MTGWEPAALRSAILELAALPYQIRRDMGAAARDIARRFSWSTTVDTILGIYASALARLREEPAGGSVVEGGAEPRGDQQMSMVGEWRC
jgi:hypothetical protein